MAKKKWKFPFVKIESSELRRAEKDNSAPF